jgi:uncharacterized surface protein with fasciclin (FAS1) repeats
MIATKLTQLTLTAIVAVTLTACTTMEKSMDKMTDKMMDAPAADIVDTAVGAGSFNTLVAAVQAAGLVDTLKGEGPFTVFAPTDAAFAALPAGTVESLLEPANKDKLTAVLTYHVIPGKVMAADIAGKSMNVDTVNGQAISVNATDGVKINNATVTTADVGANNGVIHVIDTVLLPQ